MEKVKVVFLPDHKRAEISAGETILEIAQTLRVELLSVCGGHITCGKCKVKLLEGTLSPFTEEESPFISEEEKAEGYRLACVARILSDVTIFVPPESRFEEHEWTKTFFGQKIELKPSIIPYSVELTPPALDDSMGDFERLTKKLSELYSLHSLTIDYPALLKLPHALRGGHWKVTAIVEKEKEIIDIKPGKVDHLYGLAIDIGTTTVAGYLSNLQTGEIIATQSLLNPQIVYGEDVMSRITYATLHSEGLKELHTSILHGLNQLIQSLIEGKGLSPEDIVELSIVGNTAMHHLFLGVDPKPLGVSPFSPIIHRSIDVKARDLGLKVHPSANVHLLPIEAGFVGADNVGVLIALEPYKQDEMVLIIDIGTNGELILGNRERLLSCSCATGPALEGGHIQWGMRAMPGAIERVRINPENLEVDFKVIGQTIWQSQSKGKRAKGICGSGIIDATAELHRCGILDKSGRIRNNIKSSRLRMVGETMEFVIAWKEETSIEKEITLTQKDIRNIQLAKASLYAGAKLLMQRWGIEKLDKVILAGAFGNHIDPEKALLLGMFPDCDPRNVVAAGNAAGEGAWKVLLNSEKRAEAEEIARKVDYVELTLEKNFQKEFLDAMAIPHQTDPFPHVEGMLKHS